MVIATLNFIKPLELYETEQPYFLNIPGSEPETQIIQTNLEYTPQDDITIEDIRGRTHEFSLEKNGFKVLKYDAEGLDQLQGSKVDTYCEEMAALVAEECNAVHAVCYDYRIRKNDRETIDYEKDQDLGRNTAAPPVYPVHIDHTVDGGPKRIRRHLTEQEAAKYLNGGYESRIINVWRPLSHPVEDCPIAVCDASSINPCDLVAADRVTPDFRVELYYMRYNPNQRFYWLSKQATNELWMFVNYDSRNRLDLPPWMTCPHAAFLDAGARKDAPARDSIEVRVIVFNAITGIA